MKQFVVLILIFIGLGSAHGNVELNFLPTGYFQLTIDGRTFQESSCDRCLGRSNPVLYELFKDPGKHYEPKMVVEQESESDLLRTVPWIVVGFLSPYNFTYALHNQEAKANWNKVCDGHDVYWLVELSDQKPIAPRWLICKSESETTLWTLQ
jgi:hypothetical protein